MDDHASLLLWPDTVDAFYADRSCSIRSDATRKTWGYTYRWLQRLHPDKAIGGFTTDDLVAFVTQRGWDSPRWASATARNYRIALIATLEGSKATELPSDLMLDVLVVLAADAGGIALPEVASMERAVFLPAYLQLAAVIVMLIHFYGGQSAPITLQLLRDRTTTGV
jgi:hypothetical protein